jgi:hypothetical protein
MDNFSPIRVISGRSFEAEKTKFGFWIVKGVLSKMRELGY